MKHTKTAEKDKNKEYLVLARKWRPKTFAEVIGQEHATVTLKNAIAMNRIAHAYLFTGPRGIGKTTTARIMAKALNCEKGVSAEPCDKCPSCLEIAEGINLDVIEIDGASNRGIDQIRELRENSRFTPIKGRFKIYIIDEIHMLTNEAFNALLKTLEEPPAHIKFFFATTEPQKVPETILSRCQRFDLRRISSNLIRKQIEYIAKEEDIDLEPEAAGLIAQYVEGGLRDAESILDQLISFSAGKITKKEVMDVLGLPERAVVSNVAEKIISADSAGALEEIASQYEEGKDMAVFLRALVGHFRDILVCAAAGQNNRIIDASDEILDSVKKQAKIVSDSGARRILQILMNAQEKIRYSQSAKLILEIALINATKSLEDIPILEAIEQLKKGGSVSEPKKGLPPQSRPIERNLPPGKKTDEAAGLKRFSEDKGDWEDEETVFEMPVNSTLQSGKEQIKKEIDRPAEMEHSIVPRTALDENVLKARWKEIVEKIESKKGMLGEMLRGARVEFSSGNEIFLAYKDKDLFKCEKMNEPANLNILAETISEVMGGKYKVKIVIGAGAAEIPVEKQTQVFRSKEEKEGKPALNTAIGEHPIVQKALKAFGGKIVDIRRT